MCEVRCHTLILFSRCGFRVGRVLPLPSDSWLDGSEAWWCHGGGGSCHFSDSFCRPTTVSTLSTQPQDCLIGDTCVIIQFRSLVEGSCVFGAGIKVHCAQCQYELGRLISTGGDSSDKQFMFDVFIINSLLMILGSSWFPQVEIVLINSLCLMCSLLKVADDFMVKHFRDNIH